MATINGGRQGPRSRRVPRKSRNSSSNAHGSTKIRGRWNWISRTLNGSSLKRSAFLDRALRSGETLNNNKSGGHSARSVSRRMPRETGDPRGRKREVFASNFASTSGVHRRFHGINVVSFTFGVADLCCAQRDFACSCSGRTIGRAVVAGRKRITSEGRGARFAQRRY